MIPIGCRFLIVCAAVAAVAGPLAAETAAVSKNDPFAALSSPDVKARRNAVVMLGRDFRTGSPRSRDVPARARALNGILPRLNDPDNDVRRAAAHALKQMGSEEAYPKLLAMLPAEKDRSVKVDFIRVIGEYGRQDAAPVLSGMLADNDPLVRSEAVYALGAVRARSTFPAIAAKLNDEAEGVRVAASDVCGSLQITEGVPALITLLQDRVPEVRLRAARSLAQLVETPAEKEKIKKQYEKETDPEVRAVLNGILTGETSQ